MNTDISDILATVSRHHQLAHTDLDSTSTNHTRPQYSNGYTHTAQSDLQRLTRAWVAERVAPELLDWPGELMERVGGGIRGQISAIEDLTARMHAGTSFTLVVLQTELERFKFLVRSLLRARIAKISKHPFHHLALATSAQHSTSTSTSTATTISTPLSPQEHSYLTHHTTLLQAHYTHTFLHAFPPRLRPLSDLSAAATSGPAPLSPAAIPASSMVAGPDLDGAVFVRCLADEVVVGCGFTGRGDGGGDGDRSDRERQRERNGAREGAREGEYREGEGERVVRMRKGEVWVVRWRGVREGVGKGEVELV